MPQCQFDKQNGQRCRAKAMRGETLCISHNPSAAGLKRRAAQKGGRNRRLRSPAKPPAKPVKIRNIKDVRTLLFRSLEDLRNGGIDADTARSIGYLAGVAAKIVETVDLEERVSRLVDRVFEVDEKMGGRQCRYDE